MMQPDNQDNDLIRFVAELISDYVDQVIAELWSEILVVVEIDDDASGLTYGRYKTVQASERWSSFETDYMLYFAFDAIRQRMRSLHGTLWRQAIFRLFANGRYSMSFDDQKATATEKGGSTSIAK